MDSRRQPGGRPPESSAMGRWCPTRRPGERRAGSPPHHCFLGKEARMEIVVSPSQPAPSGWSRLLVVLGVFMPVTVLALLPIGLGLERYVVTNDDMAPAIGRGAVVLERKVPVSDLRAGDVITFRPPSEAGVEGRVTRRIVSIDAGRAHTRADARPAPDPWTLPLDRPTEQRVVAALPYVGY